METEIKGILFQFMGREIYIHDTVFFSWLIVLGLCLFAFYINKKVKETDPHDKPSGIVNLMEMLIDGIDGLVASTMGEKNLKYAPYITVLTIYLVCANLIGLIGLTPPTSDINVTIALAIISFVLIQGKGVASKGVGGYVKGFFEPYAFLFPINLIGEVALPISLGVRLFGNILSGAIIMGLFYSLLGAIAPVVTPLVHGYFDIVSGLLQTFIFIMLTMVNVAMAE